MSRTHIYLAAAIAGAVLPYVCFLNYFAEMGIGPSFLFAIFANGAATGFAVDLSLSSFVFWFWMFPDARAHGIETRWPYVVLNLTIGLSCALPAYLWQRERRGDGAQ